MKTMSVYIPPVGRPRIDLDGASRHERARLRRTAIRAEARRRAQEPRLPRSAPHAFDPDPATPAGHDGRDFCQHCGCAGQPGDPRHPDGAPSLRPPTPPEAAEVAARILGERP
jgi:hypothetical protein